MPVVVKDISHFYRKGEPDEVMALSSVSLTINDGDFVLLAGRNGSGKSTLLQCMAGFVKPTTGTIHIDGKSADRSRDIVSFAIQFPERALFEKTLYEDIAFGPRNLGLDKDAVHGRVLNALKSVGLDEELFSKSPHALSHGQKRLAALAGVIATRPKYLLLDEPTAGLDRRGRERVLQLLADLNRSGMTIVISSHGLGHILEHCNRVLVLDSGHIIVDSKPEDLLKIKGLESMGLKLSNIVLIARRLEQYGIRTCGITNPEKLADHIYAKVSMRFDQ